jgi:hypothetical protein
VFRRANLRLIDGTSPQVLKRVGVHAERGEESVEHLRRGLPLKVAEARTVRWDEELAMQSS